MNCCIGKCAKRCFTGPLIISVPGHDLPADEYDCLSDLTTTFIYNLAYTTAQAVIDVKPVNDRHQLKDFWIVVTKADGNRVYKLPKTTEISKLLPGEML